MDNLAALLLCLLLFYLVTFHFSPLLNSVKSGWDLGFVHSNDVQDSGLLCCYTKWHCYLFLEFQWHIVPLFSRVKESLTTEDDGGTFLQNVGINNPTTLNNLKDMHVMKRIFDQKLFSFCPLNKARHITAPRSWSVCGAIHLFLAKVNTVVNNWNIIPLLPITAIL